MTTQPKVQRLADLLAALLRHQRAGVTFQQLRREVPGYYAAEGTDASIARMFERDKDELRAVGVPIEARPEEDGSGSRYRVTAARFYLPYLSVGGVRPAATVEPEGYRSLRRVAFTPDQVIAMVQGVVRLEQLGNAPLAHEARMGLRRLAHDLPIDAEAVAPEVVQGEAQIDGALFDELGAAVLARKSVRFRYHAMRTDTVTARVVDPYGLSFTNGRWYLLGRDHDADALRQFRIRRIREVVVNARAPGSPDFELPAGFSLWEHTRSRESWDLGDAEAETVTVRFRRRSGQADAAAQLGEADPADPALRHYRVRRREPFLRWILGLAGDATVDAPPAVRAAFVTLVEATRACYAEDPA
jgi:predicted DNA-binding transcriptional regulator YafY